MKDKDKTKSQLLDESIKLRQRIVELEKSETESRRAEEEFRRTRDYLNSLLHYANVPIIVWDTEQRIAIFNTAFERFTGYMAGEVMGQPLSMLFPEASLDESLTKIRKTLRGKYWESVEIPILRKNGGIRIALWNSANIYDKDSKTLLATIAQGQDITKRTRVEKRIKHLNAVLRAIRSINQLIIKERDRDKLLKGACENLIETRSYYSAWVALWDESGMFVTTAEAGLGKDFLPMAKQLKSGKLPACYHKDLKRTGSVSIVVRPSTCTDCPLFEKYAGRVAMSTRLEFDGKIHGLLSVSTPKDLAADKEEQTLFNAAAGDIASALYKIELEEKHKRAGEVLRESEKRFRTIFENAIDGILLRDIENKKFYIGNKMICQMLGYSMKEIKNLGILDIHPKKDLPYVVKQFEEQLKKRIQLTRDIPVKRKDGSVFYADINSSPITLGGKTYLMGIFRDITERKKTEEQIKASLKEKQLLLQEVHHRVKNNMQIISSLFSLQSGHIKDKQAYEILKSSQNRVRSMALIHERLYQSKDLAKVDFSEYAQSLTDHLFSSYGINPEAIKSKLKIKDVFLDINAAIPCALIINELVSNSLKHGFPGSKKGEIKIAMRPLNKNEVELVVSDDGIGIPKELNFRNTETLGLHLVSILVEDQLHGAIKLGRERGTIFHIRFRRKR